ncbi:SDR family oxidoreductase [Alphaproteobacteria bacterium]|nr:SDR family oxidoreductase [Alphaproteobacteria bacterium]
MRVLVTGGFGFLGGRIATYLGHRNCSIILGTRSSFDAPSWLLEADVIKMNWDDTSALERCCRDVDVVVHAAGMNAKECEESPANALLCNGVFTARLMNAARSAGVSKFIFLSTVHVYARPLVGMLDEDTPAKNLHPYSTSNIAGENAVLAAHKPGTMQSIVLRLSNAFGAPMCKKVNCWMLLVNELCRQAVQTRNLALTGGGEQLRDFIPISDVCHIIDAFVNGENDDLHSGVFNIGSGKALSVLSMAKIIQERCINILGFRPKIKCQFKAEKMDPLPLSYTSNRLNQTNLKLRHGDINEEIDHLIRFCNRNFRADSVG